MPIDINFQYPGMESTYAGFVSNSPILDPEFSRFPSTESGFKFIVLLAFASVASAPSGNDVDFNGFSKIGSVVQTLPDDGSKSFFLEVYSKTYNSAEDIQTELGSYQDVSLWHDPQVDPIHDDTYDYSWDYMWSGNTWERHVGTFSIIKVPTGRNIVSVIEQSSSSGTLSLNDPGSNKMVVMYATGYRGYDGSGSGSQEFFPDASFWNSQRPEVWLNGFDDDFYFRGQWGFAADPLGPPNPNQGSIAATEFSWASRWRDYSTGETVSPYPATITQSGSGGILNAIQVVFSDAAYPTPPDPVSWFLTKQDGTSCGRTDYGILGWTSNGEPTGYFDPVFYNPVFVLFIQEYSDAKPTRLQGINFKFMQGILPGNEYDGQTPYDAYALDAGADTNQNLALYSYPAEFSYWIAGDSQSYAPYGAGWVVFGAETSSKKRMSSSFVVRIYCYTAGTVSHQEITLSRNAALVCPDNDGWQIGRIAMG